MDLTPWQQEYLDHLAPVVGASDADVRTVVAALAFHAAADEELVAAFLRIADGTPSMAATMFGLGLATGHAAEADVRSNPAVIDLRPARRSSAPVVDDERAPQVPYQRLELVPA